MEHSTEEKKTGDTPPILLPAPESRDIDSIKAGGKDNENQPSVLYKSSKKKELEREHT